MSEENFASEFKLGRYFLVLVRSEKTEDISS